MTGRKSIKSLASNKRHAPAHAQRMTNVICQITEIETNVARRNPTAAYFLHMACLELQHQSALDNAHRLDADAPPDFE